MHVMVLSRDSTFLNNGASSDCFSFVFPCLECTTSLKFKVVNIQKLTQKIKNALGSLASASAL